MSRLTELLHHPRSLFHHEEPSFVHEHPRTSITGMVLLVLAAVGLIWMWPEIQRYMKIRRM
jgi:hypothetical protein